MKVAILLLNKGRGSGVVAKEHAQFLLSHGHEVYFMHPFVGNGINGAYNIDIYLPTEVIPVHENLPAAKEHQKPVSEMSFEEAMAYVPAYEEALNEVIDKVDIVIAHHANLTAIATANVCKQNNKPYVLFLHGTGIEPRHHGGYDDKVWGLIESSIKNTTGLMVTTEYVRDKLIRNMVDVPLNTFHIQACGVDTQEFNPSNTGDILSKYDLQTPFIICPGALIKSKGPQNIVEASKHYADLAPTVFIGDGELRASLEKELDGRGIFLGFVSNQEKARLINAATLLVAAPEKKEHFGIIYPEAMAASTPIIAYEGGGVNSVVSEDTAILTERNPDAIGKAIRSLLTDEDKIHRMAVQCRQRAETYFSTEVLGPQLTAWLETLVNKHAN